MRRSNWDWRIPLLEDDGYVYTELNPHLIDRLLDENTYLVEKWSRVAAWHEAKKDWATTNYAVAKARAEMSWDGPVSKGKAYAESENSVVAARIQMDIASAQFGLCEKRLKSLDRAAFNLGMRKNLLNGIFNR